MPGVGQRGVASEVFDGLSVNGGMANAIADILAVPDVSARPRRKPAVRSLPNM